MGEIETNIYAIRNVNDLSSRYRLVEVAGLRPDQLEYFQNRQALERRLSYGLKKPVLVIEREEIPYLVVPEEITAVPLRSHLSVPLFSFDQGTKYSN